eukprot:TRINITY_DN11662_c0_g1_i5.p1 TRINITY_DN11662_c0_g1~~TRINITY_DN11662_c0_g1_i5.p1  ORF type:complete len:134 (-),score=12.67 TRINITY_DN11662_c0_g1_i5:195-596(-)
MAQQSGNGWRPGERMYITGPESTVLAQGPWRPSKLLAMSEDPRRKDKRPVWGKGEVITSAIRQQSFRTQAKARPTDEEEEFRNSELAHRLAGVQADLSSTYVARQFKKHLETEGARVPNYLYTVSTEDSPSEE